MNIPAPTPPRRRQILLAGLLAGLLLPMSLACAQTILASGGRVPAPGSAWATDPQQDLADFGVWARKYAKTPDAAALAEGTKLAERRRPVLAALMHSDPARALAAVIPATLRAKLPADVQSRMETPFAAVGDFSVDARSGRREITVDGRTYQAHVYGGQSAAASRRGVPLSGFALDGEAVLDAGSLRAPTASATDAADSQPAPQPQVLNGNDFFSNALQLDGASGSVFDDNVGATKEFGEPNHAGNSGGASVWYTWTPPTTGQATFTTDDGIDNNTVDTLLAVYTAIGTPNVASLSRVASNDDAIGVNSQVTFSAQGGLTYYIAVDGFAFTNSGPSEGSFTLSYFQQGNPLSPTITSDATATAEVNVPFSYTITATNSPTSFSATGLPTGLSLDPATGVISGTLTMTGRYNVVLSASNGQGTGSASLILTVTDQPTHFSFFNTEVALPQSPGVYYLHLRRGNIFGYYAYLEDQNYIYHYDLGYEYTFDAKDGRSGIYLYDFASDTFFYTSPTFPFPYLYDFSLNAVLYYFPDPRNDARYNTNGVRYFYNYATGQIITK